MYKYNWMMRRDRLMFNAICHTLRVKTSSVGGNKQIYLEVTLVCKVYETIFISEFKGSNYIHYIILYVTANM
jgi:hypothetical protein